MPTESPRKRGIPQVPPPHVAIVHPYYQRAWGRWNSNSTSPDGHDSVGATVKRRAGYGSPDFVCGSRGESETADPPTGTPQQAGDISLPHLTTTLREVHENERRDIPVAFPSRARDCEIPGHNRGQGDQRLAAHRSGHPAHRQSLRRLHPGPWWVHGQLLDAGPIRGLHGAIRRRTRGMALEEAGRNREKGQPGHLNQSQGGMRIVPSPSGGRLGWW